MKVVARLLRRRARLTHEGRVVVLLSFGIAAAALNTGLNVLYLVVGALAGLLAVSVFASGRTVRGLAVRRRAPARVEAGQRFELEVDVRNEKPIAASYALVVEEVGSEALDGDLPCRVAFPVVAPGAIDHPLLIARSPRNRSTA